MINEERNLLLRDLCARLPYGIKANIRYCDLQDDENIKYRDIDITYFNIEQVVNNWSECKPYLRPMSSMTEDELFDYKNYVLNEKDEQIRFCNQLVFYGKHHFDYRGLIEKGLALEAPEGMYKTKERPKTV